MSRKYKPIVIFLWFIALGFNVIAAAAGAYCSLLTYLFPGEANKKWKAVTSPLVLIVVICLATLVYCLTINTNHGRYVQYSWLIITALAIPRLIDLAAEFIELKAGSATEHVLVWAGICVYMLYRVLPLNAKTLAIIWEYNKYPLLFMATTFFAGTLYSYRKHKTARKKPEVFNLTQDLHKSFVGTPSHPLYNKGKQKPQPPAQAPPLPPEKPEQEKAVEKPAQKQKQEPKQKTMSDQDNAKKTPPTSSQKWKHSEVGAAWKYLEDRYGSGFEKEPKAWKSIRAMLELLDSDEADVSSVRADGHFDNSDPAFDALGKINLRRHSLNVLKAIIILVQKDSILEGTSLTAALIAAIGHDFGKLGRFDNYVTGDHPLNSRKIVESYISKLPNKTIIGNILEAIEKHHVPEIPNNIIHDLLRQADLDARNLETQQVMGKDSPKKNKQQDPATENRKKVITQTLHKHKIELSADFPLDALISKLGEYTNHPKTTMQKFWKSVSQPDGYVYMLLPLFDEIIREVAIANNETAYDMIRGGDKMFGAARMTAVYNLLRDKGMAHPLIKKDYFANTWKVQDKMYNWEGNLTLVAMSAAAVGAESVQTLEGERHKIHRLKHIKICGLANRN
ncbi:MAG: HD domain-containing protein [Pseudomonadota bacterium]|nr:HD domain-containing protein [Pseudomonadota bacterium]